MDVGEGEGKRLGRPGMRGTRSTGTLGRQALSDRLALKPYWGKPTVRNFRGAMETSASSKPGPRHRSTRHLPSATRCTAGSARSASKPF